MNSLSKGIAVCSLALAAGCGTEAPRPNVLFVIADTLRADKLGCYGNERGLTPSLDALAEEGVLFEHASSHAPWTLPATASLFTSRLPREHGAGGRLGAFTKLDPSVETVASRFRAHGYATAAIVNVTFLTRAFGLMQGFDHVDERAFDSNLRVRSAKRTTDLALRWLDERDERPFLLLVHYFDAHAVYAPPPEFRARFASEADRTDDSWVFGTRQEMIDHRAGRLAFEEQDIVRAEQLYDAEVAYLDRELGRLFDGLDDRGLAEDTLVLFTADHGEEFWDHGGFEHGHTLFDELTRVPLLLRRPGSVAPARVSLSVRHIDVAPTLTELCGLPQGGFGGRSLVPLLSGGELEPLPTIAHGNFWGPPLTSLRNEEFKLIVPPAEAGGDPALFRWRGDPGEEQDLATADAERTDALLAELRALEAELTSGEARALELDAEQRDELSGLGYGGGD